MNPRRTIPPEERVLDWRKSTDPRNLHHLYQLPTVIARRPRQWALPHLTPDQGRDGACVGFGWTNELMSSPTRIPIYDPASFALNLYREAQTEDEWQGENYDGTSVNAGAIVTRRRGYITGWRWAMTIDDVIDALITEGPVVIGIPWLDTMFHPDPESGLLDCTGSVAGGHCVLAYRYHPSMRVPGLPWRSRYEIIGIHNSWGPAWGRNGNALIDAYDLARLLDQGEAAVPTGRSRPR